MLGIDSRALQVVWTIFLFGLLLAIVYFIRDTLILAGASIFFAYMILPVVDAVERLMPKRRNLALGIVYLLLIGGLVTIGIQLVSTIADEATSLAVRLPGLVNHGKLLDNVPMPDWLRARVVQVLSKEATNFESSVVPFLQHAGAQILSGLGSLLPIILVPILAFFLLKDAIRIRSALIGSVDDGHDRTTLEDILDDVHVLLSKYIRALILLAVASFAAWMAFLSLMHYPYELLLAGLAGVLEFIPVIGPLSAVIIMLIVCAVTGSGGLLWIVVFWGCFRVFQDYVLNPYLMSAGVEVHPLLVLLGVLAGERIGGIPGMFFSVPVLAILKAVYLRLKIEHARKKLSPSHLHPVTLTEDSTPSTSAPSPQ
ncbi:MAG TPA: AI-2E family transporter [Bryobacteraceae bacterium]|nr:AI-2E family transporter [Bryobacteraceae bacterium]